MPNRAQSRSQYRNSQNQYSNQNQSQSAAKDKTSQLLKNYENIIRKEKEKADRRTGNHNPLNMSQQNYANNDLIKRISKNQASNAQNKSLHNE